MDIAMRVLVVEDEKKLAGFIKQALKEDGHAVELCHDGDEAGHLAAAEEFDAIVLDLQLPGRDGLLHISQISHERVNAVSDHLKEGQVVKVKVLEADDKGRVRLSMKAVEPKGETAKSGG